MEYCDRGRDYHPGEHMVRGTQGCDLAMVNLALRLLISGSEEMAVEFGLGHWHAKGVNLLMTGMSRLMVGMVSSKLANQVAA